MEPKRIRCTICPQIARVPGGFRSRAWGRSSVPGGGDSVLSYKKGAWLCKIHFKIIFARANTAKKETIV